jgi:hypothetical protein
VAKPFTEKTTALLLIKDERKTPLDGTRDQTRTTRRETMKKQGTTEPVAFHDLDRRKVVAQFDGGTITSDAGALLLREVDQTTGILRDFTACFTDFRNPDLIEHTLSELVAQRVYALALGYEDVNDHDELRVDPLLATLVGKGDPTGQHRRRKQDRGKPLAGKSTLNRLELTPKSGPERRYKKIVLDGEAVDRFFVDVFLQAHRTPPERVVLDLDATDDPLHGDQEGRFFHGYYKEYCYMPLYIFCGAWLLCARIRRADNDASAGTVEELERIVPQIRAAWPHVEIVIRADSGFAREEIMAWCEENDVRYVLGLAKNSRLKEAIEEELRHAEEQYKETGRGARVYRDFTYSTRKSWSRERRVVGKAEHLAKGANPRFVVTNIPIEELGAQELYEEEYCARGDMENRIKEQQLFLFADRTSTAFLWSNQVRVWFSSVAYTLLHYLRAFALEGTVLAKAQCNTIRLKLLKIGALIKISVRRVLVSLAESYPYRLLFMEVLRNIRRLAPVTC